MTQIHGVSILQAGKSSPETISCDQVQWLPELCCRNPFDGTESKLKQWACMPAEDDNIEAHDDDYQHYDGGFAGGGCGAGLVMKKGPWTAEEDEKLKKCVEEHGVGNWMTIEKYSGLARTSKSCRLRWTNHLRPNLKKGSFTLEEERLVVKLHQMYGNKWSYIASKLPGRTDNEVKNFWHGRVRRCHRKFLPIYPENIEDDGSCKYGLDIDGKNNLKDEYHSSTPMDETESVLLCPPITLPEYENTSPNDVPFQEKPNSMDNQNPSFTFTPPEPQLFPPHQGPASSPHGLSSSNFPSPRCYTTQMPASPMNIPSQNHHPSIQLFQSTETSDTTPQNPLLSFQEDCSSPQQSVSKSAVTFTPLIPPPVLSSLVGRLKRSQRTCSLLSSTPKITRFSAPEQGSCISASGSSITSLKTNVSSPTPLTATHLHSPQLHLSVELPAVSSEPMHISSMPSDLSSSNLNSQDLNKESNEPPCSFLSFNQTSSIKPDSCVQQNQSAEPSLVIPLAWDYSVLEPPSVQTPTSAFRPIPQMNINQPETDAEILDAPTQEAIAKADTLCQKSLEDLCVDGYLRKDIFGKNLENETFKENAFHQSSREGSFFCEKTRKMNSLGQSLKREHQATKKSKTRDLVNQRFCGKSSHNRCFKLGNLMGQISRREGLLSEISKTGVLLVERGKKETILQGLLDKNSTQDVLASKRSMTKDMQLVEISKREKLSDESLSREYLQSEIYNRKDFMDQKSEEDLSLCGNFASSRNETIPHFEEIIFDISPRRSISLNLQKQTREQDGFDEVSCDIARGDDMLASRGREDEFKTPNPIFSHSTEVAFLKSGDERDNSNYSGTANGPLNESLREECSDTSKGECMQNQPQSDHYIGEDLLFDGLLTLQDKQEILHESVWGPNKYTTTDRLSSTCPEDIWSSIQPCGDDLFGADVRAEVSSGRSLKNEVSLDKCSRESFQVESSSERTTALHELTLNEFVSSTSKSMAAQTHCSTGFGECYEMAETKQDMEMEEAYSILPEEFSDLLDFFPTNLPDWYNVGCQSTSISDKTFELETNHHLRINETHHK